MKCFACGYDDTEQEPVMTEYGCIVGSGKKEPFVEIIGCFMKYNFNTAGDITGSECADLYACPNCGTVRMDIGC